MSKSPPLSTLIRLIGSQIIGIENINKQPLTDDQNKLFETIKFASTKSLNGTLEGIRGIGSLLGSSAFSMKDVYSIDPDTLDRQALIDLGFLLESLADASIELAELSDEAAFIRAEDKRCFPRNTSLKAVKDQVDG